MNYNKIIKMLNDIIFQNGKKGIEFSDFMKVLNNKEVKQFLDDTFKNVDRINLNNITNKNYLLKQLLEIYFMENDIMIIDDDVDDNKSYKDIDILNVYFNDINGYNILTREEEVKLFNKYNETKDVEIKKEIIKHNLKLVINIAKKYSRFTEEGLKEAIQDGNEGLIIAVDKFDVSLGNKFSTFAYWWISQYIQRNSINNGRMIRLPVHFVERINKINILINKYFAIYGKEPSNQYLAEKMGLPVKKIIDAKKFNIDSVSYDTPVGEDEHGEESTLIDFIEGTSNEYNVEKKVLYNNLKKQIQDAINTLTEKEKIVISMRFGIEDDNPQTLEEVGKQLGLTRERIRQIEFKALKKLEKRRKDLKEYLR